MTDVRTDAALWAAMASGDVGAWGELFDRHAERVSAFCVRFVGNSRDADDVLSETFLEAWRAGRSFSVRDDSALPILLAVARRACQKRLRSEARRRRRVGEASVVSPIADIAESVAQTDLLDRRRAWLRHRVAELPVQFRDVVELVVYAEMPYADAARVLGVPVGTVKSRMARARHLIEVQAEAAADALDPADRALLR